MRRKLRTIPEPPFLPSVPVEKLKAVVAAVVKERAEERAREREQRRATKAAGH